MKKAALYLAALAAIFASCRKEEQEKPKVIYDTEKAKPAAERTVDTTRIIIADLPIQITGTDYLVHPIGDLRVMDGRSGSRNYEDISYNISNYSEFEITGYLRNLKFQRQGSDSLTVLTDSPVMIQSATYLGAVAERVRQQLFVYTLSDLDTNKDGRLDQSDIRSLYLSQIDGSGFVKISPDMQELVDWKIVPASGRLYFRTLEDTNKNGEFDRDDQLHYSYVDLSAREWKAVPYNPV